MELDILNDIFSNTVGDLFSFNNKYNIYSTGGNRQQNNANGKITNIKQGQVFFNNELVGGQQQIKTLLPNHSANHQQVLQPKQQQQVTKPVGINQSINLDSNGIGLLGNENKKIVSMSLNSSIQNSLLDQSSNQLNTSKDSISRVGGQGGNASLNTSFNSKNANESLINQSQNVFRDSTNTIKSSQFVNNFVAGVHQSQQVYSSNQNQTQMNGFNIQNNMNNNIQLSQNVHQQNINNSAHNYQNNSLILSQQGISQQQTISQQQQISQQYFQNNQHQLHMNNGIQQNSMKNNHGVQNNINTFTRENNKENVQMTPEEWIKLEAPHKLEESMKRLGLDNQKITQRMIKEMNYDQLQTEKKRVKNELKLYDIAFENHFKIEPTRNQKEPMRPLYVYYKGLKQALSKCQNENKPTNYPSSTNGNNQNYAQNGQKKVNQSGNVAINSQTTSAQTSIQLTTNSYQNSHNNSFDIHNNNFNTAQNYLNSNNTHQNLQQNNQLLNNPQLNNLFQNNQMQNSNQSNILQQNNQYQNVLQQNNSLQNNSQQNNSFNKQNITQNRNLINSTNSNTNNSNQANSKMLQIQNQQQRVNNTQIREPTRNNDIEINKNKELLQKNSYKDLLNISLDQKENYNNIQSHQQHQYNQQSSSLQLINNKQTNNILSNNNNTNKDQQNIKMIEQKITLMKRKRVALREQLQVYQDDFYRTHNRKIKYHKDILPVENEYKEYKDIKKEIMKLEMMIQPQLIQQ